MLNGSQQTISTNERSKSDNELISEFLANGTADAFEQLVSRYWRPVYAVCLRVLGDSHAAEDACQITFMILMRKGGMVRSTHLGPWLYMVANRAAQRLKRGRATARELTGIDTPQEEEEWAVWERIRPEVDDALCSLKDSERQAIVLRYFEGHSTRAASEIAGCSIRTFNARLQTALGSLRNELQRRGVQVTASAMLCIGKCSVSTAPAGLESALNTLANGGRAPSPHLQQILSELENSIVTARHSTGVQAGSRSLLLKISVATLAVLASVVAVYHGHSFSTAAASKIVTVTELFTRAEHFKKWKVLRPNWRVEGAALVGNGENGNSYIISADALPINFELNMSVESDVHYHFGWDGADSPYFATIFWEPTGDIKLTHWLESKGESTLLASAKLSKGKHHYKIILVNNNLVISIDGQRAFSCPQFSGSRHNLNLFVARGAGTARFENITVREAFESDIREVSGTDVNSTAPSN